jgi:hypothetical protein
MPPICSCHLVSKSLFFSLVFMVKGVITSHQEAICTMSLGGDTQPLLKL